MGAFSISSSFPPIENVTHLISPIWLPISVYNFVFMAIQNVHPTWDLVHQPIWPELHFSETQYNSLSTVTPIPGDSVYYPIQL